MKREKDLLKNRCHELEVANLASALWASGGKTEVKQ
jgi:hypothetical protein